MKVKNKFLTILFSLIIFFALLSGVLAIWAQKQSIKQIAYLEGVKIAELARTILESKVQSLVESAEIISSNPVIRGQVGKTLQRDEDFGIAEAMTAPGQDNLERVHEVFQSSAIPIIKKYKIFIVLTEKGQVIYSNMNPKKFGQYLGHLDLFKSIIIGKSVLDVWGGDDKALNESMLFANPQEFNEQFLVQSTPIITGNEVLGFIIAGTPFVEGFLRELKNVVKMDLAVRLDKNNVLLTEEATKEKFNIKSVIKDNDFNDGVFEKVYGGENFLYIKEKIKINGLGFDLIFSYPIAEKIKNFSQNFFIGFIISMSAILLLTLWIGASLTNSLTGPLTKLIQATKEVGSGGFPARLEVVSTDEVGDLTKSFNNMIDELSAVRIDPVTGLFSEGYLRDTLTHHLLSPLGRSKKVFILFLKTKKLDEIHQMGGLQAVNENLIKLSEILKDNFVKNGDILARTEDHSLIFFSTQIEELAVADFTKSLIVLTGESFSLGLGAVVSNPYVHTSYDYIKAAEDALKISLNSKEVNCVFSKGSIEENLF